MKRCCSASGVPSSRSTGTLTKAMAFVVDLVAAAFGWVHLKVGSSSVSNSLAHWPFPSDGPGSGCRACRAMPMRCASKNALVMVGLPGAATT